MCTTQVRQKWVQLVLILSPALPPRSFSFLVLCQAFERNKSPYAI